MQTVTYTTSSEGMAPSFDSPFGAHALFVNTSLVVTIGLLVMTHVILAQAVSNDVKRLARNSRRCHYFGPFGWAVITLFFGILGLGAHWVMHYSTFRDVATDRTNADR